jgi:AcrR family transcriptional regulator
MAYASPNIVEGRAMPQVEGKRELIGAPERRMPRYARGRMTYDLILREAERIILEEGPSKLNIRNIAKSAKISPATIYEYFADGAEICDRLLWRSVGEILDDLERYIALERKVTLPRVFVLMFDALLAFHKVHPALIARASAGSTEGSNRGQAAAHEIQRILIEHKLVPRPTRTIVQKIQLWLTATNAMLRLAFQVDVKGDAGMIRIAREMIGQLAGTLAVEQKSA